MKKSRVLKNYQNQITCEYGVPDYKGHSHLGVDIVGKGSKLDYIIACDDGYVIMAQSGRKHNPNSQWNETYGNMLKIKHNNGEYYSLYAHMSYISVGLNDTVKKGQVIGYMGNSGNANGAHLHFEVFDKNNKRVNPINYIDEEYSNYKTGRYKVKVNSCLHVRTDPTINSRIKTWSELTENAKIQNRLLGNGQCNGLLSGVIVDVFEVNGEWGRVPSGWINLKYCIKL